MLLVVDVGNTNITGGIFEEEELKGSFRMTTKIPEGAVVPMTVRLPFRMWGRRLPMQRAEILSK